MSNLNTFMAAYERNLRHAVENYPQEYGWPVENVPAVVEKMRKAFEANSYNKDGRAIKAACKELGIAHTYKAINAYLNADLDHLFGLDTGHKVEPAPKAPKPDLKQIRADAFLDKPIRYGGEVTTIRAVLDGMSPNAKITCECGTGKKRNGERPTTKPEWYAWDEGCGIRCGKTGAAYLNAKLANPVDMAALQAKADDEYDREHGRGKYRRSYFSLR